MLCYCHFTWNEFNPQLFISWQILQNFVVYVLFEWEILIFFSLLLTILGLSSSVQFYCFLYWSLRQPGLKVMIWGSCPECLSGHCRASPKLLGSWAQVLGGRLYLFFSCFLRNADSYKPLPQGAVGHSLFADSLLEQKCFGYRHWIWLWSPALNGVLLVTVTIQNSNYVLPDL